MVRLLAMILILGGTAGPRFAHLQFRPSATSASPESPSSRIAGRRIFATTCASCHGLDAQGSERPPNILLRPEVQHMSDEEIYRVIRDGTTSKRMPGFGSSLDSQAVRDVTAYLRGLFEVNSPSLPLPGDPASGKSLFFGTARCAECHAVNGSGGFLGPDLSTYARSHTARDIGDAITNPDNPDRQIKTVSVVTRHGDRLKGIARNQDNFSLQLQTPDGVFHLLIKSDLEQIDYPQETLMPADYQQRLDARELNDLVSFLMRAAATTSKVRPHRPSQPPK